MTQYDEMFALMGVPALQELTGEWILYIPLNGAPREVFAIYVDRSAIEQLEDVKGAIAPRLVIQVPNDPVQGIASYQINTGGDRVRVSLRKGVKQGQFGEGPWPITKLLKDVNAITRFEVR